jgi:DNA invertase Pin-like site-specific DNA recombinase
MKTYVAYFRVSTQKQGQSGLGLEAQRKAVGGYLKGEGDILKEYVEVESGKKNNRGVLTKAIEHANRVGATLLIAKLDRLSRNASFIFTLKDSGVDFICADMPEANTLTIGIFAVLAQHERELISSRTKAALAAKKAQGFKLGSPGNLSRDAMEKAWQACRDKASNNENNRRAAALIASYKKAGMNFSAIARALNEAGFRTSRGKFFQAVQVQRLFSTIGE